MPTRARAALRRAALASAIAVAFIVCVFTGWGSPTQASSGLLRARVAAGVSAAGAIDNRIGIDLDDVATSSDVIFTDVMKQASPWSSDRALRLDAEGDVMQLAPGQVARTTIFPVASYPSGDYTLLYAGRGTIAIDPRSGSLTSVANGRAIVHVTARVGYGIRLALTATDPKDAVRDLHLILPGYEATYERAPFAPAFLARIAPYSVLRFVHWSHGDSSSGPASWLQRTTDSSFTQAGAQGVAWEYQIALANAVGADPWFVVPAGATNFYVSHLAALVHAQLDPRLRPMYEYADGAWRPGSPTNVYAAMAGRNFHLAADAQSAALAWYAIRSTQVFELVAAVYGTDAGRIVRVLSGPVATPGSPAASADRSILATDAAARNADVFAIDSSAATAAALAYTRSLLGGTRLTLVAGGGAVSFTSERDVVASTRADLERWRGAGGGLFAASSVNGFFAQAGLLARLPASTELACDGLRASVLAAYVRAYPTARVMRRPVALPGVVAPASNATGAALSRVATTRAAAAADIVAIDAGGSATANWAADEYYSHSGNWTYTVSAPIVTSGIANPAPQAVYQSQRTGTFSYTIPGLTPGQSYTLRLHFAELYFSKAGQRVFNVNVNGTTAIGKLDVFASAGAQDTAIVKSVNAVANGAGQIVVGFAPSVNNAIVNGIEVQSVGSTPAPTAPPTSTPPPTGDLHAVDAGGPNSGNWVADEDYSPGSSWTYTVGASIATTGVVNPAPQAVYQSQRTGAFTYTIPGLIAGQTYTLRLHFAELYFTAAGQRVFNVTVNGTNVLSNFDVYAAAGATDKAIVESSNVAANTAGQLVIGFTPTVNNAIVNGIEVLGASGATPSPTATPTTAPTPPGVAADVTTYHNDSLRTGWYQSETALTTAAVASSSFGLKQTLSVDGLVMAQPLFVSNYPVNGANHNVLVVATEHNSVYAFDADSGGVLWQRNLGPSQSSVDIGCTDIEPESGINSTPVIDRSSGSIYVVFASEPSANTFVDRVASLDLGSGNVKTESSPIAPSAVQSNGSTIAFAPGHNYQRASLLLANNSLYLGFGSHCDDDQNNISGWLLRYSTSSLAQLAAFNTVEDNIPYGQAQLGSIWSTGFGPAADAAGNVYAVTGNGAFDANTGGHNYSMSVLRFTSSLAGGPTDYFSYANEANDSNGDLDLGSGGAMLLPAQSGSYPNLLVAMGKTPNLYVLNASNLGRFSSSNSGALDVVATGGGTSGGVWGGPAYYNGPNGPTVYYHTSSNVLRAFSLHTGSGAPQVSVASQGSVTSEYGGSIPVVSSNGTTAGTGVVWDLVGIDNGSAAASLRLDAYDATNVSRHLFSANAGVWSHSATNTYVTPLVANGKVYAGAYKTVYVFGLK